MNCIKIIKNSDKNKDCDKNKNVIKFDKNEKEESIL